MAGILAVAVAALVVCMVIFEGYALSILWGWFVVPTFGAPELSIPVAIGIAIPIGMMTKNITPTQDGKAGEQFAQAILRPLFALGCGWIVLQFV